MKMDEKLYAILDAVARVYFQLSPVLNAKLAERSFENWLRQDTNAQNNPQDYSLYEMGEWNSQTGKLRAYDDNHPDHKLPVFVIDGVSAMQRIQAQEEFTAPGFFDSKSAMKKVLNEEIAKNG
jgi:hypothetical protein